MMFDFDPKGMGESVSEIIPETAVDVTIGDALEDMEPVVEALTEDISGIGPKAAERYLLRYEYGFASNELADRFDVTPQTVANQVTGVRKKILKYPRLSRIVGTLRAHRAALEQPAFTHGATSTGDVSIHDEPLTYEITYNNGSVGRPYSWQYAATVEYHEDDRIYHLHCDYVIDAIHGTFLKRIYPALSLNSWERPSYMHNYDYYAYALPNVEVPNDDGSLKDAAEHHLTYDINEYLGQVIEGAAEWDGLLSAIRHGQTKTRTPSLTRSDILTDRLRRCDDDTPVEDYATSNHIRKNVERLLREYPLERPWDLPYETITQLWNGHPTETENHNHLWEINKQDLYALTTNVHSRHNGRDVTTHGRDLEDTTTLWQ